MKLNALFYNHQVKWVTSEKRKKIEVQEVDFPWAGEEKKKSFVKGGMKRKKKKNVYHNFYLVLFHFKEVLTVLVYY